MNNNNLDHTAEPDPIFLQTLWRLFKPTLMKVIENRENESGLEFRPNSENNILTKLPEIDPFLKQMTRQESPPSHQTEKTKQMLYLKIINKKKIHFLYKKMQKLLIIVQKKKFIRSRLKKMG